MVQIRRRVRLQKIVSHWESIIPVINIREQKLAFTIELFWLWEFEVYNHLLLNDLITTGKDYTITLPASPISMAVN